MTIDTIVCPECNGTGTEDIRTDIDVYTSIARCLTCDGAGFVDEPEQPEQDEDE